MTPPTAFLCDTNILLRLENASGRSDGIVTRCFELLEQRACQIYYTPQNISEFWNVATRPAQLNGFGLLPEEADAIVLLIEEKFHLAADSHETYKLWRSLILDHQVSGVRVHDVKLIASALAHRIPAIITSNGKDFKRFRAVMTYSPMDLVELLTS